MNNARRIVLASSSTRFSWHKKKALRKASEDQTAHTSFSISEGFAVQKFTCAGLETIRDQAHVVA
jgi:hypothetical protein